MGSQQHPTGFDLALADLPTCALDESGAREQRARYARLSSDVTSLEREPEAVVVEFAEGFDRATLEEALAVERACCPFFRFDLEGSRRRLRVTVREPAQLPALDAIADAIRPARLGGA
jgi:hypothetical protein